MKLLGFKDTDNDPCIYYNEERRIFVVVHIDDGLIVRSDEKILNRVLDVINLTFSITCRSVLSKPIMYLGMQI